MIFEDKKIILTDKAGNEHIVAEKVSIADNFYTRFLGLMGQKQLPDKYALLLSPCSSIHMMFMRFAIDVIYVDKDLNVVKVTKNIKPWRLDMGHRKAKYTIELPAGTIDFEPVLFRMVS